MHRPTTRNRCEGVQPFLSRRFHRITAPHYPLKTLIIIVVLLFVLSPGLRAQTSGTGNNDVYGPVVSGFFYPKSKDNLQKMISGLLSKVTVKKLPDRPLAIISPHAGYDYSGGVAAYGYSAVMGKGYNRAIVLAPSHYGKRYRGVALLKASQYKTPLGEVKIDREVCDNLAENSPRFGTNPLFGYYSGAYKNEHSIETQLPLLQTVLGEFKLVPLLIGLLMDDDYDKVADAIRPYIDDNTLVVVSSDFTHYGRRFDYVPFFTSIEQKLKNLDQGAINHILKRDFDGFVNYREETGITVCGFTPIAVLIKILSAYPDVRGTLLKYDTSGRMVKDFSNSVSYASIIFTVPAGKKTGRAPRLRTPGYQIILAANPPKGGRAVPTANKPSKAGPVKAHRVITDEEGDTLLSIARTTLETYTRTKSLPEITADHLTPRLREKSGAFVTLKKNGRLRGCIGHIQPRVPLWRAVMENTTNSACHDMRFSPVREDELKDIDIEISVLSPLRRINGPEEFRVGEEGIIIRLGNYRAVFLPQVATEQGWDRGETLSNLCVKAGLPWYAWWNENMEFYVFTASVIHEGAHETSTGSTRQISNE